MSKYTLSPLGLINTSGFAYNKVSGGYESIFSSYDNREKGGTGKKQIIKNSGTGKSPVLGDSPHQDQIYDISTSNIIQQLSEIEHLKLDFADFAYLKDFGVYPNNRLVVCRRFAQPVRDDIYSEIDIPKPISTVLGYVRDDNFPMKITVSEKWADSDASFTTVLNELGEDFGMKGQFQLGNLLEGGMNVVPLPGFSLIIQRKLMAAVGIINDGTQFGTLESEAAKIPQGDPNLIKESQKRTLIKEESSGSGLTGKFTITLKTTYEQKFINGVDPSIVFMDVINNALSMGTSPEVFYLGRKVDAGSTADKWFKDFQKDPTQKIKVFLNSLITVIEDAVKFVKKEVDNLNISADSLTTTEGIVGAATTVLKKGLEVMGEFIAAKYKYQFLGIITALTGAASTPWHITIGNPLRPIFCSGDMLCTGVTIDFGPQLSFNDLPTYISVEVALTSARNLGMNEIFAKFNSGGLRVLKGVYQGQYTGGSPVHFFNEDESTPNQSLVTKPTPPPPTQESQSTDQSQTTNTPEVETRTQVSENGNTSDNSQINPDPNAESTVVDKGDNSEVDDIKDQTQQETTGNSEGQSEQIVSNDDVPNEGLEAQAPQEEKAEVKANLTYRSYFIGESMIVVDIYNNGKLIKNKKYSVPTFNSTSAIESAKDLGDAFGILGEDGKIYKTGEIPK